MMRMAEETTALLPSDDRPETTSATDESQDRSSLFLIAILMTAFSYGCILTTLFLLTLPIECERIHVSNGQPKSVLLGIFVAIAGFSQLISPLIGRLSDVYEPPRLLNQAIAQVGQRMPYYGLGGALAVTGLMGQTFSSYASLWLRYTFAFFFSMVGLNMQYAMMIALIPDQVPRHQTGVANGILALLLVTGSLFGFGLFYTFFWDNVGGMYTLYTMIVLVSSFLTLSFAHDSDAALTAERIWRRSELQMLENGGLKDSKKRNRLGQVVQQAQEIVLTPAIVAKSMIDPLHRMPWMDVLTSYTIDTTKYHDFFIVTMSRLFYYCGMSVQTFFLYFVHDILNVKENPEGIVAALAILGQFSGAFTCLPVGVLSDRLGGRRKPFVYVACAILASATLLLVFATRVRQMIVFCAILGAANGVYLTMDTSLAVDTLPDDLDGSSGSAQLLGIWGVAAFVGSAFGPMIGGPLLYLFGHKDTPVEDDVEEYSLTGYAVILGLSSLYFLCSAVTLRFTRDHRE